MSVTSATHVYFTVITVALPGIKEFLGEVLVEENLSDKGEQFRLDFVDILDKLGSTAQGNEIYTPLTNDHQPPHQSGETHRRKTEDDLQGDIEDNTAQTHWSAEAVVIGDKVAISLRFLPLNLFSLAYIGKADIA